MTVIYRMTNIPSTNPSPILQGDKFALNRLCLRSFVRAFKNVRPYVYFILDHCDSAYILLLQQIVPFEFDYEMTNIGINETMLKSYKQAKFFDDDVTLFQECDYFYLDNTGRAFENGIRKLGLVSPYDHLNFYQDSSIHSNNVELALVKNHHYRTTERNTMTFGVTAKIFRENYQTFYKYGYLDNEVWKDLKAAGHPLYTPLPTFATHMVKDFLSPSVDWKEEFETYL